jgi:hypothetical protein
MGYGSIAELLNGVYNRVRALPLLAEGGEVWVDEAGWNSHTYPRVILTMVSDSITESGFNTVVLDGELQVDVFTALDSGSAHCRTLANEILTALDGANIACVGWQNTVTLQATGLDGTLQRERDSWRCILLFRAYGGFEQV